jgi:hypothetical protein
MASPSSVDLVRVLRASTHRPITAALLSSLFHVAVIAVPRVHLALVCAAADSPSLFESLCVRVTSSQFTAIIVYRPPSRPSFNWCFHHRRDDTHTRHFSDVDASYCSNVLPMYFTHQLGGVTDDVVTRADGV